MSKTDFFFSSKEKFELSLSKSVHLLESRSGIQHTGRQNRILTSFSKTIIHGLSIRLLYRNFLNDASEEKFLDHFSIGALTRVLIDSAIMTLYLSEPKLSLSEWDLRRHVLFLHDLVNRKRFLTDMYASAGENNTDWHEDYKIEKKKLVSVIEARAAELNLSEDKTNNITKGNIVFIDGLRGAVREANAGVEYFSFIYTYLSNHIHGHPASFIRSHMHKLDFGTPSDYQFDFSAICLEAADKYLDITIPQVDAMTGHMDKDPNEHID